MEGKLYTAQEIFDALQTGVESLYDKDDPIKTYAVAKLGTDIAYETMRVLGFDKDKVVEYCKKKIDEKLQDLEEH
jgi:hypothetical protein